MDSSIETVRFFSFNGRIGRLRYFAYPIGVLLLILPVLFLGVAFFAVHLSIIGLITICIGYIFYLFMLVLFMIRRLHDMDYSGWWVLVYLVLLPFSISQGLHLLSGALKLVYLFLMLVNVGFFLILLFKGGTKSDNRYGPLPPPNSGWVIAGAWSYLFVGFFGGMLLAIAIPVYQDYIARAQMSEALVLADNARISAMRYYFQYKYWPKNLADAYELAGQSEPVGHFVNTLQAVSSGASSFGVIATMKSGSVARSIRGRAIEMWTNDGGNSWSCGPASSNPVNLKYLPGSCRDTDTQRP